MSECYENDAVSKNVEKLYLEEKAADIHFVFPSETNVCERIPAHTQLLAATSDVFSAMFYGELKEKGEVTIIDATASAFKEFLQFFYKSEIKLTKGNMFEVYALGHKYDVAACADACVPRLKELKLEDACTGLALALLYDDTDLMHFYRRQIVGYPLLIFKTASFLECDRNVLAYILKIQALDCSEVKVFEACMSWVNAQSGQTVATRENIETHLGDLFYEIRFASMTVEEFTILSSTFDKVFSSSEIVEIIQMIVMANVPNGRFSTCPRQIEWNNDAIIVCDRYASHSTASQRSTKMRNIETLKFSTLQLIILGSFICSKLLSPRNDSQNVAVDVTIIKYSSEGVKNTLSKFKAELSTESETTIRLPKPILLNSPSKYEIQLRIENSAAALEYKCPQLNCKVLIDSYHSLYIYSNKKAKDIFEIYCSPIKGFGFNHV